MKDFKDMFSEIFTFLAWVTLLAYIFYCTIAGIKTDSIRDAWNVLILIAGFVWGSKHQKAQTPTPPADGVTTTELNLTATTTKGETTDETKS